MKNAYKWFYGVAAVLLIIGAFTALGAARSSAYSQAPASDDQSNAGTLMIGGASLTAILGAIVQVINHIRTLPGGSTVNDPHQAIFAAILAGLDMASGNAAETQGSQTFKNGKLTWDIRFSPGDGTKLGQTG